MNELIVSAYDKLRSFIVYIIGMNGLQDLERRRLLETAKIPPEDSQAITNLGLFDVTLSSGQEKKSNRDKVLFHIHIRNIRIGVAISKREKRRNRKPTTQCLMI